MRYWTLLAILLTTQGLLGQVDLKKVAREILDESFFLYRHERASWLSTDLLTDSQKQLSSGYFTYEKSDTIKSVYFDKETKSAIVKYNFRIVDSLNIELINFEENKKLSDYELMLLTIRNHAHAISSVFYSEFGIPQGINPNLIIKERPADFYVYSIPGTYIENLIPIGGDYWFTYTKLGKSLKFDFIHRNLIPFEGKGEEKIHGTGHEHRKRANKYITPTDICTLLLYKNSIEWDTHEVISKGFISTFNLRTISLTIEPNTLKTKM